MRTGLTGVALCCCFALALGAGARDTDQARPHIETTVRQLVIELSAVCPLADPGNQKAFDLCRQALFRGSLLRTRAPRGKTRNAISAIDSSCGRPVVSPSTAQDSRATQTGWRW